MFADSPEEICAEALRVIDDERAALDALRAQIGDSFVAAVQRLLRCKGRIIITGMGKSGHIGRKIAATMSSTGTPAYFVHPGEASHGDMGQILDVDVVIAISNSGETPELNDTTAYCQRRGIDFIAITKNAESTLARYAYTALVLPDAPEACPMRLAPTSSTTATLALGDALAVCLLTARGFDKNNFRQLHPGGKLGQALLRIEQVMRRGDAVPLIDNDTPMEKVLPLATQKSLGCVGVTTRDGKLIGIITDGDIRRWAQNAGQFTDTAEQVMTHAPIVLPPETLVESAIHTFEKHKISGAFVSAPDLRPLGFLHIHDCLG